MLSAVFDLLATERNHFFEKGESMRGEEMLEAEQDISLGHGFVTQNDVKCKKIRKRRRDKTNKHSPRIYAGSVPKWIEHKKADSPANVYMGSVEFHDRCEPKKCGPCRADNCCVDSKSVKPDAKKQSRKRLKKDDLKPNEVKRGHQYNTTTGPSIVRESGLLLDLPKRDTFEIIDESLIADKLRPGQDSTVQQTIPKENPPIVDNSVDLDSGQFLEQLQIDDGDKTLVARNAEEDILSADTANMEEVEVKHAPLEGTQSVTYPLSSKASSESAMHIGEPRNEPINQTPVMEEIEVKHTPLEGGRSFTQQLQSNKSSQTIASFLHGDLVAPAVFVSQVQLKNSPETNTKVYLPEDISVHESPMVNDSSGLNLPDTESVGRSGLLSEATQATVASGLKKRRNTTLNVTNSCLLFLLAAAIAYLVYEIIGIQLLLKDIKQAVIQNPSGSQ